MMTEQQTNDDMNQEASPQLTAAASRPRQERPIELPSTIAVNQLATMLNVGAVEVIKQLMRIGVMANINQVIDYEIAAPIAQGYGHTPSRLVEQDSVGRHEEKDALDLKMKQTAKDYEGQRARRERLMKKLELVEICETSMGASGVTRI